MRKSSLTLGVMLLAGSAGCDMLRPTLTVKVKAVLPCDQGNALDGVGLMQIKTVDEDGATESVTAKKSGGSAKLQNLTVADGMNVFISGFPGEDPGAVDGVPSAVGAVGPLDLKKYSDANRFPAARSYPEGNNATVSVPMGRVNSFASTTDVSNNTCSGLGQGRHAHTATFSRSTGTVILIGGFAYAQDGAEAFVPRERTVEEYDPVTGTFSVPEIPSQFVPLMQRAYHTATELPDGTILVWGGIGPEGTGDRVSPRAVSFVLNPSDWSITQLAAAQGFQIKRFNHQATLTRSGSLVVMSGGCGCKGTLTDDRIKAGDCPAVTETCTDGQPRVGAVDIFDTTTKTVQTLRNGLLDKPRAFHTATALEGEIVVIAGGDDGVAPVREVEVFRGQSMPTLIKPVTDSLDTAAVTHAAAVALNSQDCTFLIPQHPVNAECVLITGGCLALPTNGTCSMVQSGSTIVDFGKIAGARKETGPAGNRSRWGHQAFYLPGGNNMVMVAGGDFDVQAADSLPISAELLRRQANMGAGPPPFAPAPPPMMVDARMRYAAAMFPSGLIMLSGGVDPTATGATRRSLSSAEFFFFPFE